MSASLGRRPRVALVDDDPGLLRLLSIRLKSESFDVAACESVQQAAKRSSSPRALLDAMIVRLALTEKLADVTAVVTGSRAVSSAGAGPRSAAVAGAGPKKR